MTSRRALLIAAACGLALACSGGRSYVRPNADLSTMRTVSVLPFENMTSDRLAGERVQRVFLSELLNFGAFEVVEPGLVVRLTRAQNVDIATLGPEEIKKLGEQLKVEGIFLGTVIEYEEGRSGSTPVPRVTVQLRLVDTATGATVWSIQRSAGGATVTGRLFGIGGHTAIEATEELFRKQLAELAR